MTINKNSVEQINVALLDMDKKIKSAMSNGTSASDFKNLEASVDSIKRALNETKSGLEPGKTYNINISGNAATATKATTAAIAETATTAETAITANHVETADKVANALTVNGKTYDGSSAVDAGVQTVANGGTGVTTQADINKAFIGNLEVGNSDVTDGTEFVSSWASNNGFAETADGAVVNTPYKRQFIKVWNYIKGKISNSLEVFIKSKTVTVGDITIPSDNYLEIDVGLTSSDTVISAKLSSWSSNTGVFSIMCYAKNRVFIVGDAGTTITNVSVQAIYI